MAEQSESSSDDTSEGSGRNVALHRLDETGSELSLVSAQFFTQLEQLYRTALKPDGQRYWELEGPTVCVQIGNIAKKLRAHYRLVKPFAMGGAGIVCLVENLGLSSIEFANGRSEKHFSVLKLPRPVAGQAQILNRIIYGETTKLLSLNHQNLVRIEYADREESGMYFYVMQLLDQPKDADDAVRESPTLATIMSIFRDALAGLQYLHGNGIAHLDIKPGNLFATTTHTVVGDLGFAKSVEMPGLTTALGGTRGFQHPDHLALILEAKNSELDSEDDNRLMSLSETFRDRIKKEWDLYSLGVTMLVLLNLLAIRLPGSTATYEFRYLKLMAYRMLGGQVQHAFENTIDVKKLFVELKDVTLVDSSYLGIPAGAFGELRYSSIEEVVGDLMKLTGESDLTKLVPELAEFQSETIQASSLAPVPFTSRMRAIIDSREIADLAEVDQLGLVKLIYPVASHSRMEHALGTTALAAKYARALVADTINPIFKQLMSKEHLESLILAALTHDIGHYPLAHDLEEVDPKIFHHELRTAHLLSRPDSEVRRQIETDSWSASIEDVLAIHEKPGNDGDTDNSSLRTQVLRSIIDGPIDADKVDYLTRDSQNLRLPYGTGIDVDKLISTLTVVVSSDTQGLEARLGIHEKGRIPAESVAFARYALFGSAYWHKTHRVLKAMLSRIAIEALWKLKQAHRDSYRDIARRDLYELLGESDDQLLDLGTGLSEERVEGSRLDAMSQLIVLWLANQASIGETVPHGEDGEFRRLARDLLQRRHFKRVLVISRVRAENQSRPWQTIDKLFGETTDTWENRRLASIGLQNRVSGLAASLLERSAAPESKEVTQLCQEFVRRTAAGAPLVILDSPPAGRVGSSRPLEILHEPYWIADARAELSVSEIEDSSVWSALAGSYPRSLGKIRVFCNPDFAPLVALLAGRQQLEQLVWDAVAKDSRI